MKRQQILIASISLITILFIGWMVTNGSNKDDVNIIVTPSVGKFEVIVTTTGELRAKNSTEIKGPTSSILRQMRIYQFPIQDLVPEGTRVSEGDYVARLDQSELNTKISEAKLNKDKAEHQYTQATIDSALTLSEKRNSIANLKFAMQEKQAELEQSIYEAPATKQMVKIAYEKAQREYEQAVENYSKQVAQSVAKVKEVEADLIKERRALDDLAEVLSEFTIKAPADGMVIYDREWNGKKKNVGTNISFWNPTVAILPDLSVMESITFANEIDIQKLGENLQVHISLDAMPDKKLTGVVTSVANVGEQRPNSDSKVFEVLIQINESDTTLLPSMTTSNEIIVAAKDSAMFIPLECLHAQDSVNFVYQSRRGGLAKQEVEVGMMNENYAEILQGLERDEKIYLSMPSSKDTTGIELYRLAAEELAKR